VRSQTSGDDWAARTGVEAGVAGGGDSGIIRCEAHDVVVAELDGAPEVVGGAASSTRRLMDCG
jgi:hypothetical protein